MESRLRQLARHGLPAPPPPAEQCDLCGEALPDGHQHLLDTGSRGVLCACQACGILFDRKAAGNGHYRLIRHLRRPLPDFRCDDVLWAGLGTPVELAFFVRQDGGEPVLAHYPSPIGVTGAAVPAEAWQRLAAANPVLSDLDTEVVALLVRRARDHDEHWLVGLDDCYRLSALLRRSWTGMTGGDQVWPAVDGFFDDLRDSTAHRKEAG